MAEIKDLQRLEALYEAPVPSSLRKVSGRLTPLYQSWIEQARFCILSTVGPEGVHGSPRGDDGPVVRITDAQTLLMPDWRGNNRLDCLRDIVVDGRVALLFMISGSTTTVRVNGFATLRDDAKLRASFARGEKQPASVIVISIQEVYTQCAKALLRSGLWVRNDKESVPSTGEILAEMKAIDEDPALYDALYVARAQPRMW